MSIKVYFDRFKSYPFLTKEELVSSIEKHHTNKIVTIVKLKEESRPYWVGVYEDARKHLRMIDLEGNTIINTQKTQTNKEYIDIHFTLDN